MEQYHKYVRLDVHKERNEVAIAQSAGEVRLYGSISNDLPAWEKLVAKLHSENVVLRLQQLEIDGIAGESPGDSLWFRGSGRRRLRCGVF